MEMNLVQTEDWLLFIDIRKKEDREWFGAVSLIRSPIGFSITLCGSLFVGSKRHAQLLIVREVLLRIREFHVSRINCSDHRKIWQKLLKSSNTINWSLFPAFDDIMALCSTMQVTFYQGWQLLSKEVRKLTLRAATTQVSLSYPVLFQLIIAFNMSKIRHIWS